MKKLSFSVISCGVVSLFVSAGGALAADANSYIQAHIGGGAPLVVVDTWAAPVGAQGPIRSEMSSASGMNPHDGIQAALGGDGRSSYLPMKSTSADTWSAPSGAQGPIRSDFTDDKMLFPLSAGG